MKRRSIISIAGSVTIGAALPTLAQGRVWRIGVVYPTLSKGHKDDPLLHRAMRELGYDQGRNVVYERRFSEGLSDSEGHDNGLSGLFAALVKEPVDLILTFGDRQTSVAKIATSMIPIVMLYSDAPVEIGLVASLSHPGRNITGVTTASLEAGQKSLQMLRDIVPRAKHLGILLDPNYSTVRQYMRAYQQAAADMGCKLTVLWNHSLAALDASLATIAKDRVEAVLVSGEGVVYPNRARIVEFAALHRLPAMYVLAQYVSEGGLIARSADESERTRRVAAIIDRILKGEKPANIPVEQPTRFNVTVNLKTAKAMGLTIPQSVLLQATEVIE